MKELDDAGPEAIVDLLRDTAPRNPAVARDQFSADIRYRQDDYPEVFPGRSWSAYLAEEPDPVNYDIGIGQVDVDVYNDMIGYEMRDGGQYLVVASTAGLGCIQDMNTSVVWVVNDNGDGLWYRGGDGAFHEADHDAISASFDHLSGPVQEQARATVADTRQRMRAQEEDDLTIVGNGNLPSPVFFQDELDQLERTGEVTIEGGPGYAADDETSVAKTVAEELVGVARREGYEVTRDDRTIRMQDREQ